ncbi:hypothetical protein [Streptomyces sp. GC420]|uniref:hypothetical protein n=1 Tax=Streptomyces sp. GC420 TaxID=2697568 RepID=UPI001FB67C5B|nr:hypothetical protein [Streptomyces sp. GC420]
MVRRLKQLGWTHVRHGAWAEPGREVDLALRVRAEQLIHPQLVASHFTAARLHGIEVLQDPPHELESTGPPADRIRLPEGKLHRAPLPTGQIRSAGAIRVTTVSRTLADLLRSATRDQALVAVDSALSVRPLPDRPGARRGRLALPEDIAAVLAAGTRKGRARGERYLRLADPRSGSPAETIARLRLHDANLYPETQAELRTPDGRRLRPDFLFRREGVVVEIEGYAHHGTRGAHRHDIDRFNALNRCHEVRTVLRFTAIDALRRPERMVAAVRAALARAAAHP